jgi:hypothetical protein
MRLKNLRLHKCQDCPPSRIGIAHRPPSLGLEEVRRRLIDGIEGEDPTAATRLDELTHRERLEHGRLDGDDCELDIPRGLERVAGLL